MARVGPQRHRKKKIKAIIKKLVEKRCCSSGLHPLKTMNVSSVLHWNYVASLLICRKITSSTEQSLSEKLVFLLPFKISTHICSLRFRTVLTKSRQCFYFLVTTSHRISLKFFIILPFLLKLDVSSVSCLQIFRPKLCTHLYPTLYRRHQHGQEIR